ncbi:carbonic anhydrase [bacterium]|nr:MAG: carbonic anhydrase [bacterium]
MSEQRGFDSIVTGIQSFRDNSFEEHRTLFEDLTHGQKPKALFITCSDSRIDPNLVTQSKPGDLFIMRNAGNIVPPFGASKGGEEATVEYALLALGIDTIIVCGHSHCGAMQGLISDEPLTKLPSVANWLQHAQATRLIVKQKFPDLEGEPLVVEAGRANVLVQLDNLRSHPAVALKLSQGRLKLHGWVYTFETGEVLAYDENTGEFGPLSPREAEAVV